MDATPRIPQSILILDRNFWPMVYNGNLHHYVSSLTGPTQTYRYSELTWDANIHQKSGTWGMVDGSVQQGNAAALDAGFQNFLAAIGNDTYASRFSNLAPPSPNSVWMIQAVWP
jgi:hypothetical protein